MNLCGSCMYYTGLGSSPDYGYCLENDGYVSGYDQQACYTPKPIYLVVCSSRPEGHSSVHGVHTPGSVPDSTEESSTGSQDDNLHVEGP